MNMKDVPDEDLMAFVKSDEARDGLHDNLKKIQKRLAMHTAARFCMEGDKSLTPNEQVAHGILHVAYQQLNEAIDMMESAEQALIAKDSLSQAQADMINATIDHVLEQTDRAMQGDGAALGVFGFEVNIGKEKDPELVGMDDMPDFVRKAFRDGE